MGVPIRIVVYLVLYWGHSGNYHADVHIYKDLCIIYIYIYIYVDIYTYIDTSLIDPYKPLTRTFIQAKRENPIP